VETIQNEKFTGQSIIVDNTRYETCTFTNCILVYQGGEPPVFDRCSFPGSNIQLEGAASSTIRYMRKLNKVGFSAKVQEVLAKVRNGTYGQAYVEPVGGSINTGTNYRQMAILSAAIVAFVLFWLVLLWYGYMYNPQQNVLMADTEMPLRAEIPLDVMPALPDTLSEAYDLGKAEQLAQLEGFEWVDEADGIVSVPIDVAIDILLQPAGAQVAQGD